MVTNPGCAVRCRHGLNSVITFEEPGIAGLGDRANVLEGASNLAVSLCSRLVVMPPARILSRPHNRGARLGDDVSWSRYFDFVSAETVVHEVWPTLRR